VAGFIGSNLLEALLKLNQRVSGCLSQPELDRAEGCHESAGDFSWCNLYDPHVL
jgi:nucleoside-diphosphate-sugar epimerase